MDQKQKDFLEAIKNIQEITVNTMICNLPKYKEMEDILYDVTYETIFKVMELIDGYNESGMQLDIIDKKTCKSIKNNDELHDVCVEFLRCTDI